MKNYIIILCLVLVTHLLKAQSIKIDNLSSNIEMQINKEDFSILIKKDLPFSKLSYFINSRGVQELPKSALNDYDSKYYYLDSDDFSLKNGDNISIVFDDLKTKFNFKYSIGQQNPKTEVVAEWSQVPQVIIKEKLSNKSIPLGENIFNDAKFLIEKDSINILNYLENITFSQAKIKVLASYNIDANSILISDGSHPFILKENIGLTVVKNSEKTAWNMSGIAKTDVTNFAIGMSRFLVDRAKQELNESFFQRMYKEMDKMPDLQYLFPQSYFFLRQTNAHNIHINIEQLRASFEEDVKYIHVNLYNAISAENFDPKYSFLKKINEFLRNSEIGQWIDLGLYTVISTNGQINPKDLFEIFVHSNQFKSLQTNFTNNNDFKQLNLINAIKLAELISNSLLSSEANRYWVSTQEINELFQNEALFKTYIGLLLAKSTLEEYAIAFYDTNGKKQFLKPIIENLYIKSQNAKQYLSILKQMIKDLYSTFQQIDEVTQKLTTANSSDELISEVYKYYSVFKDNINAISSHLGYRGILGNNFFIDNSVITQYVAPCMDMAYHIKVKKYNLAINNLISILNYTYEYHNKKNNEDSQKSLKKTKDDKELSHFITKFARYGTLIGTVAEAKNSDEVKAAIEASVLPVGSSRIKRYSRYSISLNAYAGAFYGQGFYKVEENGVLENKNVQTFGITAPIGLSFNMGALGFKKKSSLSLTMQVIDLGALVNFYAKNGDGASLPTDTKIQLGDILAPGAQLTYSLGNSPFSLIGGIQYVPNLSRMPNISTNTNFTPIAYRLQVGLVIDIPLFNLKVWE